MRDLLLDKMSRIGGKETIFIPPEDQGGDTDLMQAIVQGYMWEPAVFEILDIMQEIVQHFAMPPGMTCKLLIQMLPNKGGNDGRTKKNTIQQVLKLHRGRHLEDTSSFDKLVIDRGQIGHYDTGWINQSQGFDPGRHPESELDSSSSPKRIADQMEIVPPDMLLNEILQPKTVILKRI